MSRNRRKNPSTFAILMVLLFVAVSFAIAELLLNPLILILTFGVPLFFWWGRLYERDMQNGRRAEHAIRHNQPDPVIPELENDDDTESAWPDGAPIKMGVVPEWLRPDGSVKPFDAINPAGADEARERLISDPRSGVRDIRSRRRGPR